MSFQNRDSRSLKSPPSRSTPRIKAQRNESQREEEEEEEKTLHDTIVHMFHILVQQNCTRFVVSRPRSMKNFIDLFYLKAFLNNFNIENNKKYFSKFFLTFFLLQKNVLC